MTTYPSACAVRSICARSARSVGAAVERQVDRGLPGDASVGLVRRSASWGLAGAGEVSEPHQGPAAEIGDEERHGRCVESFSELPRHRLDGLCRRRILCRVEQPAERLTARTAARIIGA
jgi:hypothetical protein